MVLEGWLSAGLKAGMEEVKPAKRKKILLKMLSMIEIKWALETTISTCVLMTPKAQISILRNMIMVSARHMQITYFNHQEFIRNPF